MPRKPLLYLNNAAYHISARSNNREWFYISKSMLWELFEKELSDINKLFEARIHAFVLMDNHYHMLVSTGEKHLLDKIMQHLQKNISQKINRIANRTNHIFGGPYKGCLISSPHHYMHVIKYIYRNPVKAHICLRVEDYAYSTLNRPEWKFIEPFHEMEVGMPASKNHLVDWLNEPFQHELEAVIQKILRKTIFKPSGKSVKLFNAMSSQKCVRT